MKNQMQTAMIAAQRKALADKKKAMSLQVTNQYTKASDSGVEPRHMPNFHQKHFFKTILKLN